MGHSGGESRNQSRRDTTLRPPSTSIATRPDTLCRRKVIALQLRCSLVSQQVRNGSGVARTGAEKGKVAITGVSLSPTIPLQRARRRSIRERFTFCRGREQRRPASEWVSNLRWTRAGPGFYCFFRSIPWRGTSEFLRQTGIKATHSSSKAVSFARGR